MDWKPCGRFLNIDLWIKFLGHIQRIRWIAVGYFCVKHVGER